MNIPPVPVKRFQHLDLFTGIGGFVLAAQQVWGETYKPVLFCEIDKFCQKVLQKHWPDVPIISDIKDLDGTKYTGRINLLTGGFPCQPFSVAGKQKGQKDDRYLWPEMLRVIEQVQPTWIIGENVANIVNMALDQVLSDLEIKGYTTQSFIIPACAVNAPHRRDRVWIVAHTLNNGHCTEKREIISPQTRTKKQNRTQDSPARKSDRTGLGGQNNRLEKIPPLANTDSKWKSQSERNEQNIGGRFSNCSKDVADSKSIISTRSESERSKCRESKISFGNSSCHIGIITNTNNTPTSRQRKHGGQILQESKSERLDITSGKNQWTIEPAVGRVVDGIPNRVDRLKCLGNAIVSQVAMVIMQAIKTYIGGKE